MVQCPEGRGGHLIPVEDLCYQLAVLVKKKNDKDALRVQLFCHIHLSNFEAALQLLDSSPLKGKAFERAYCLWKLNRFDECAQIVDELADVDAGPHLAGLLHMRQGNGEAALQSYMSLVPKLRGDKEAITELVRRPATAVMFGEPISCASACTPSSHLPAERAACGSCPTQ